jgi:glycosyltransferase involved in cell wall biosynthesis
MKILTFLSYYLPGFKGGGPIRTIENMVNSFHKEFIFFIITRDRDLGSKVQYYNVDINKWEKVGSAFVRYLSPKMFRYKIIKSLIFENSYDVLYLNSFFSFSDSILPLLVINLNRKYKIKIILAPRGEFSEGALKLKYFKKFVFIFFSKLFSFHDKVIWQASSTLEADDIKKIFNKKVNISIAPDLTINYSNDFYTKQLKLIENNTFTQYELNLIFFSRITPKKNLLFLLDVIMKVSCDIILDIYGPIEDKEYWEECKKSIKKLPINVRCEYKGIIYPSKISIQLSKYDLFIFPTLGENFGHVIFESLISGTPVFLSDQTPWKQIDNGILSIISLDDKNKWIKSIEEFKKVNPNMLDLKKSTIKYAMEFAKNDNSRAQNFNLFAI